MLAHELRSPRIGASDVEEGRLGVSFVGSPEVGARAVLWSRTALRVMELLASAPETFTSDALYEMVRESVDWRRIIDHPDRTLSVSAVLGTQRAAESGRVRPGDWTCASCGANVFASKDNCFRCGAPRPRHSEAGGPTPLTHSHFSALTVKNAVCDTLRDDCGWRPSVDRDHADVPLFLHCHKGEASLYRILSGSSSMHKRGYRSGAPIHVAALRETLAASILLHAQYEPSSDVLCDPMAGSGTLPVEAALIATDTAPGLLRAPPSLTRWPDADRELWPRLASEAEGVRLARAPQLLVRIVQLRPERLPRRLRLGEVVLHRRVVGAQPH